MIREVKARPQIEDKDYEFKLNHIIRFLEDGAQVKVIIIFRGRETARPDLGERVLLRFAKDLEKQAKAELPTVMDGRQMFLKFTPKVAG